ncbi:MAG: nucleotidyltransferase family protein [Truepera sp.]|nr:nucleotidyltransferase family protein [Truepera sp.]
MVLAGGESRRMGRPKLLLEHGGKTLLAGAVERAGRVADRVIAVVGAYGDLYRPEAEWAGATVVDNPEWPEGLASSLRAGVSSLGEATEAALVILPDQPFITSGHLEALIARYRETDVPLVFSRYHSTLGPPALIARPLFPNVLKLRGDRGAKALAGGSGPYAEVTLPDGRDVDTPTDLDWLDT